MRTPRRLRHIAAGSLLRRHGALIGTGHTLAGQPLANLLGPPPTPIAYCRQRIGQHRRLGVKAITEDMQGMPKPLRRHLDTAYPVHAQAARGLGCFGQAINTVMISQGDHAHACLGHTTHQLGGRQAAIGGGTVHMQVNNQECSPGTDNDMPQ